MKLQIPTPNFQLRPTPNHAQLQLPPANETNPAPRAARSRRGVPPTTFPRATCARGLALPLIKPTSLYEAIPIWIYALRRSQG